MKALKRISTIVIGVIAGIVLVVFGAKDFLETKALKSKGKTAQAEVTNAEERSGRRGRKKYYVSVAFKTEGGEAITSRSKVPRSVYEQASATRKVNVTYLPEKPEAHRLGNEVSTEFGSILIGLAVIGFTGFSALRGGMTGEA